MDQIPLEVRTIAAQGSIPSTESTDTYFLLDTSGSFQATNNLAVFINIRNLRNETYIVSDRPHGVRSGLPRTFTAGLKIDI